MKKAISILLAVATLAFATTAMAATDTSGVSGSRNSKGSFVASSSSYTDMPCFRPGDTVSFTITGAAVDDEITLITYKLGESLSDASVQYIQQYTAAATTQAVSYKVRDLASGVYQLDIKVGTNALYTVYYKVGKVSADMIVTPALANSTAYVIKERTPGVYSIGFVGRVTVDAANITLSDIGAAPGFRFSNDKEYKFGIDGAAVNTLDLYDTASEICGGYSFVYGMTIYDVPAANVGDFTAAAITE